MKVARRRGLCEDCGRKRRTHGRSGLCETCHSRKLKRKIITCGVCKEVFPGVTSRKYGLDMCFGCYYHRRSGERKQKEQSPIKRRPPEKFYITCQDCGEYKKGKTQTRCSSCCAKRNPKKICKDCGEFKTHSSHGCCSTCAPKHVRKKKCANCGKSKIIKAWGLCSQCYFKQYSRPTITCRDCKRRTLHCAKGLCNGCHNREYKGAMPHKTYVKEMNENTKNKNLPQIQDLITQFGRMPRKKEFTKLGKEHLYRWALKHPGLVNELQTD